MRGLYFPFQLLQMLVVMVVALMLFVAREPAPSGLWWRPWGRFEALAAGFTGLYLLSAIWAADTQAALQATALYVFSLAGLLFVTRLDAGRRAIVLRAAVGAGSLVALLGFAAAAGNLPHANGYTDYTRVLSALQYPNTTAAYLMVCITIALGLGVRGTPRPWAGGLYSAAAASMIVIFIFTQSRGGLLVFPLVLLALWLTQPRGARLRLVQVALAALLGAAPAVVVFGRYWNDQTVSAASRPGVWLAFVTAVAVAGLAGAAAGWLAGRSGRVQWPVTLVAGGLPALAAIAFLASRGLPQAMIQRFHDINLTTNSVASRLVFNRDAFQIVREHPFVGVGGGGWNAVYHAYQSFNYFSTQVHDDFMQVWVETGTVGLLLFLGLWAALVVAGWRLWRRAPAAEGVVAWIAAVGLGLHSAIDFNLSLGAVNFLLWTLWGAAVADARAAASGAGVSGSGHSLRAATAGQAAASGRRYARRGVERGPGWIPLAFHGLAGMAVLGSLVLIVGFASADRGAAAMNGKDYSRAQAFFGRAVAADPFQATYHMDYGQSLFVAGSMAGDDARVADGRREMATAVAMTPYDANLRSIHADYLFRSGDVKGGFGELRRALSLNPTEARRYEALANAAIAIENAYVQAGKPASGKPYLEEALGLRDRLRAEHDRQPAWADPQRTPAATSKLDGLTGQIQAILGDWAAAVPLLQSGANTDDATQKAQMLLWLGEVQQKAGDAAGAAQTLEAARQALGQDYETDRQTVEKLLGSVK